jgi:hypothetical protein
MTEKADHVPGVSTAAHQTGRHHPTTAAAGGKIILGDDVDAKNLASAVDAALDAAAQQIMVNQAEISNLPTWAQQVLSLAISAGETVDELLDAMGIADPDDGKPLSVRAQLEIAAYLQHAKSFTPFKREDLAKKGHAMGDGSFPIENTGDLKNAISAFGRAGNKAAAKAHIIKRAKALGATDMLPDGWK